MPTILGDPTLEALIADLDARSESQREDIDGYFRGRAQAGELSWEGFDDQSHRFMADKLVALDRDKAEFCYLTCRALGARRIVEVGTSFGISTLYLAAAVRDNGGGRVIGTELEPTKHAKAEEHLREAGLDAHAEVRLGDALQTLADVEGPIDLVLLDGWKDLYLPILE